jgi:membrane-bound serine protease (ClpP class)
MRSDQTVSRPEVKMIQPIQVIIRRTLLMIAALAVAGASSLTFGASSAAATSDAPSPAPSSLAPSVAPSDARPDGPFVDILEVDGRIDPVTADFVLASLKKAKRDKAQVVVIQLNSPGSVLSVSQMDELTTAISAPGQVPVAVWVGPSGARARQGAVELLGVADFVGVGGKVDVQPAGSESLNAQQAIDTEVADVQAPVLADFIGQLDGRTLDGHKLDTAQAPIKAKDGRQTASLKTVRFQRLGLLQQLLHNMANPGITFLLLTIGLALAVFEFYTGGVGVAGAVAVFCAGLGAYGLGVLPTRPLGAVMVVGAFVALAIDVQAGQPRFWTAVGTVSLAAGSRVLFTNGVSVPLWWAAIVVIMIVVFMVGGMPTMIRTRFATPTIGRESMIGELGTARTDVSPDGVVTIKGAPWKARTNRATPISAGSALRVAAIDGLVLEVEPLEGAARDHRESRK